MHNFKKGDELYSEFTLETVFLMLEDRENFPGATVLLGQLQYNAPKVHSARFECHGSLGKE